MFCGFYGQFGNEDFADALKNFVKYSIKLMEKGFFVEDSFVLRT